jgi:hypothetical protein
MPRTCTVCNHERRDEVDRALLAGEPFRHIATRFGKSTAALQRHKADHLLKALVKAKATQEILRADTLLEDVRDAEGRSERLCRAAEGILGRALGVGDLKTALNAIRVAVDVMGEAREYMQLRGQLTGELNPEAAPVEPLAFYSTFTLPRGCQTLPELPAPEAGDVAGSTGTGPVDE